MSNELTPEREGILQVDVRGKSLPTWNLLRPKMIHAVNSLLDSVIDHDRGTTVRDEVKEFQSAILDYAREKLAKTGLENDKVEAEVRKLYSEMEKDRAETRKVDADARSVELDNSIKELRMALGMTKAMLIGDEGEEAVLFGKQIDDILYSLKEIVEK